jgi:uncharacterized protein DUF1707/2TM domain-containing protein
MCYTRERTIARHVDEVRIAPRDGVDVPPSGSTRVGDREREEVMHVLSDAFADGRLTREEFDARSTEALVARTGADLESLTADLPPGYLVERRRARQRADHAARAAARLRTEVRSYLAVMIALVAIWLGAGLAAQTWYPWFVWPALGWGIGIITRSRKAAGSGATAA